MQPKSCPKCHLLNPRSAVWCDCGYVFDSEAARRFGSKALGKKDNQPRPTQVTVSCPGCHRKLRLQLVLKPQGFKCPTCGCRFEAVEHPGSDWELRVVFDPKSLTSYFKILDVTPHVSKEELHSAYRRRISEYHPDKVAALGAELRSLAEEKTKQINEAYRTILDFQFRNWNS